MPARLHAPLPPVVCPGMSGAAVEHTVFLLTRDMRQRRDGLELTYWGIGPDGPVRARLNRQEAVFFVERDVETLDGRRRPVELQTMEGQPVDAIYFTHRRAMRAEADRLLGEGTPAWEADVKPADRVLMERFVTGGCRLHGRARQRRGYVEMEDCQIEAADVTPDLRVASFDVESEGLEGPILSVAIVSHGRGAPSCERAFVRGSAPPRDGVSYESDEPAVLRAFLAYIAELDPDVLIGWNVIAFDLTYLEERCRRHGVPFDLGRGGARATGLQGSASSSPPVARVPGRVVLDGIATMRAATWSFERWGLEHVGQALLGRGKKIDHGATDKLAEILRLAREDLPALIEYNLEDCRLVRDIFEHAHVLDFAIERQRLTGLTMDRRAGAVAAFDHLYLPRLHRAGRVAPSTTSVRTGAAASPGGHVMDSVPGLHEDVLVLDFKSLYPSLIRTFLVDPLGLALADDEAVPGFDGGRFHRTEHILPSMIETLWAARDEAKAKRDAALSRAIKIQMNSFYGVLGSPVCRFFDPRLASSITRRGHQVLRESRRFLEERGHRVIYGDTDSVFVILGPPGGDAPAEDPRAAGQRLATTMNAWWAERLREELGLESALEIEMETVYRRFLMPTMRGSQMGSKKRYAGVVEGPDGALKLVIKGLEAVRTDWTPLARSFQRELLRRVFANEPYAAWIRELTDRLFRGELDEDLVYRKRLRRDVDEYTKNVPPHVAAARQLDVKVREVAYVITRRGPQPIQRRTAGLDYEHYLERQLAPAAAAVLPFLGEDFMRLGGRQLSLF